MRTQGNAPVSRRRRRHPRIFGNDALPSGVVASVVQVLSLTFDKALPLIFAALLLAGCDLPTDSDGATVRIAKTHALRVGLSDNPPWVRFENGKARGVEAELVEGFAQSLGAQVHWTRGAESRLVALLKERKLDLMVGGVTTSAPWTSETGVSRSFTKSGFVQPGHVILTAPGENRLLLRLDRFLESRSHA
jgi:hypothetical protein